jgi:hypothetical protein
MFYSAQGTDKPEFLDEHIYESAQSQDSWTHQYALTAMAEVYMSDELLSEDSFTYVLEEV